MAIRYEQQKCSKFESCFWNILDVSNLWSFGAASPPSNNFGSPSNALQQLYDSYTRRYPPLSSILATHTPKKTSLISVSVSANWTSILVNQHHMLHSFTGQHCNTDIRMIYIYSFPQIFPELMYEIFIKPATRELGQKKHLFLSHFCSNMIIKISAI